MRRPSARQPYRVAIALLAPAAAVLAVALGGCGGGT
ncbi:MAG: hypothetical protein JWQ48_3917, partial [Conexibacter sp.]|nr:hypothetical protein [Conexibacter sp.]